MSVAPAVYVIAMIGALVYSSTRWKTLERMLISWTITVVILIAIAGLLELATRNTNSGLAVADFGAVPSFIVPSVIGVIHARKSRSTNRNG